MISLPNCSSIEECGFAVTVGTDLASLRTLFAISGKQFPTLAEEYNLPYYQVITKGGFFMKYFLTVVSSCQSVSGIPCDPSF